MEPGAIGWGMGEPTPSPQPPTPEGDGMAYETIIVEKSEGVQTITLNRPEVLNAFNMKMLEELGDTIADAGRDESVRAVLFKAAGRAFAAGADLNMVSSLAVGFGARQRVLNVNKTIVIPLQELEKPVIAAVNGHAAAAGASLALASDIIIAAESAKFSQVFLKVGLFPDMASLYFLPRLVGQAKAKKLILTNETIDAREAERIGMISEVVPDEQLIPRATSLAKQLANGPTKAIGVTKKAMNRSLDVDLATLIEIEAYGQALCCGSDENQEGTNAFLEKRAPRFHRD
ncbi:MAG: 2-(1,2-epoxy-1,2-dihydrophenyl)acetyl-CoA isomerase [Chloroflexota bacterium]|nr:MAG: 2-(1,2-epoxy-1,2-dihydrophenyl)acetyl-CoA isomerase [Chloroflexota bacterium]